MSRPTVLQRKHHPVTASAQNSTWRWPHDSCRRHVQPTHDCLEYLPNIDVMTMQYSTVLSSCGKPWEAPVQALRYSQPEYTRSKTTLTQLYHLVKHVSACLAFSQVVLPASHCCQSWGLTLSLRVPLAPRMTSSLRVYSYLQVHKLHI